MWLRQLQAAAPGAARGVATDLLIAVRSACCALGAVRPAARAAPRARRLDRADAPRLARAQRGPATTWVGRQGARAHLAGAVVLLAWGGVARCAALVRAPAEPPFGARARVARRAARARSSARARLRRRAVPQLQPRADAPAMKSSRRSTRASPGAGRRCSPTSTNTRCTRCATSTSADPTSSTRRRRSPALAARLRPGELDRASPALAARYPLIVTRRDPRAPPPAGRLPAGVAGRLLRGVGAPAPCGGGDRAFREPRHASGPLRPHRAARARRDPRARDARRREPGRHRSTSTWRARAVPARRGTSRSGTRSPRPGHAVGAFQRAPRRPLGGCGFRVS